MEYVPNNIPKSERKIVGWDQIGKFSRNTKAAFPSRKRGDRQSQAMHSTDDRFRLGGKVAKVISNIWASASPDHMEAEAMENLLTERFSAIGGSTG